MIPDLSYSRAWLGVERDADVEKLWNNMMSIFFDRVVEREGGFIPCISKYVSSWLEKRAVLRWKGYQKMSFYSTFRNNRWIF